MKRMEDDPLRTLTDDEAFADRVMTDESSYSAATTRTQSGHFSTKLADSQLTSKIVSAPEPNPHATSPVSPSTAYVGPSGTSCACSAARHPGMTSDSRSRVCAAPTFQVTRGTVVTHSASHRPCSLHGQRHQRQGTAPPSAAARSCTFVVRHYLRSSERPSRRHSGGSKSRANVE